MSKRRVRFSEAVSAPPLPQPVPTIGPVVLTVQFDGQDEVIDFSDLPCPRVTRPMATALAELHRPKGLKFDRRHIMATVALVRDFLTFLCAAMPEEGECVDLDDLEPELLDAYEQKLLAQYGEDSSTPFNSMSRLMRIFRRTHDARPDGFSQEFQRRLGYAASEASNVRKPLDAYPFPVFDAMEAGALAEVGEIRDRILAGERLADRGQDPDVHGWDQLENVLWWMRRNGPLTGEHRHIPVVADSGRMRGVNAMLFLSSVDMAPFQILLACQTGMEPEAIKDLKAGCLLNPARGFVSIAYLKRRAGADPHKTLRVRDGGNLRSPGGVLRLAMRLNQLGRDLGGYDALWVTASRLTGELAPAFATGSGVGHRQRRGFIAKYGIDAMTDRDGKPVTVDLRRLRKTYKSKQYLRAGGVLPDFASGHSKQVAGSHYADIGAHEEIHEQAVEAGLAQALAVALPPPVVLDEDGERLDDGESEMASETVRDALSGATDVWVSACQDFFASPYAMKKGAPCPVPPWVCLECPNAVFTTRHLPAVLSTLNAIERQREEFSAAEWAARFGLAHERITSGVLARFSAPQIVNARAIAEADGTRLALPGSYLETIR